jgi:hypothetical protein
MAIPTNAQKAAVWLVITMDSGNFDLLMTAIGDEQSQKRDGVINDWHLDPDAVAFVKGKLTRADVDYVKGIRTVANGFARQLVSSDWGDDVCPGKGITAGLHDMISARTVEHRKAPYLGDSGKTS